MSHYWPLAAAPIGFIARRIKNQTVVTLLLTDPKTNVSSNMVIAPCMKVRCPGDQCHFSLLFLLFSILFQRHNSISDVSCSPFNVRVKLHWVTNSPLTSLTHSLTTSLSLTLSTDFNSFTFSLCSVSHIPTPLTLPLPCPPLLHQNQIWSEGIDLLCQDSTPSSAQPDTCHKTPLDIWFNIALLLLHSSSTLLLHHNSSECFQVHWGFSGHSNFPLAVSEATAGRFLLEVTAADCCCWSYCCYCCLWCFFFSTSVATTRFPQTWLDLLYLFLL